MIERIDITSRDQWLALRGQDVTASVAGALAGVHPYVTPYSLYLLKSGLVSEDPEETAPMRRGKLLEPVAVELLRELRPKWKIGTYPVGHYLRDADTRIGATPDVNVVDEDGRPGIVQVKSIEASIFRRDWTREDRSIEPPLWIAVQSIIEAKLSGAEFACVAAMVVSFGIDLHIIEIPIHEGVYKRIEAEVDGFWKRIADKNPPPPNYAADGEVIARLYPGDNGSTIDLSGDNEIPEIVEQLENARALKKSAEISEFDAKAAILHKMGEARFALLADGRRISYGLTSRKGYYVEPTEYRMCKVLKK